MEHKSSLFATMLSEKDYILKHMLNIYGTRLLQIPTPKYVIFYKGNKKMDSHFTMINSLNIIKPWKPKKLLLRR